MSAPVTSPSPNPAATLAGGTSAVSLNPLMPSGSALFGNLLSMGLSNTTVANSDTQTSLGANKGFSLDSALLLLPDDFSNLSQEDLESVLSNIADSKDIFSTKILVSLTPGVPSKDALESLKSKLAELGIDTKKFTPLPPTTADVTALTAIDEKTAQISVPTSDVVDATNILLIATGLNPSEMEQLKEKLKVANSDAGGTINTLLTPVDKDTTDATESPAMAVLVVFVMPIQKPADAPVAQDINFDLSSLSAFTQLQDGQEVEPDWSKKLSQKLNDMSLSDLSSSDADDASPFDAEINALLSFDSSKGKEVGFQGSISATHDGKNDGEKSTKSVSGELTSQAMQALSNFSTTINPALQNLSDASLLIANGSMATAMNPSSLTNPLFTSAAAIGTHPTIQAMAMLIEKAATGSEKAKQELSIQLDPPELGRMQVQLSLEKDGLMKVHVLAEKQETLTLLQRDAHALKSALDSAGVQIDNSSLTFDLGGGDQSFNQLMGGQDNQSNGGNTRFIISAEGHIQDASNMEMLDSKMDFIPDKVTGNIHYSLWA